MDIITYFVYLPKAEITWLKFPCCYFLVITALKFTYRAAKTGEFPRIFSRQIEAIVYKTAQQIVRVILGTILLLSYYSLALVGYEMIIANSRLPELLCQKRNNHFFYIFAPNGGYFYLYHAQDSSTNRMRIKFWGRFYFYLIIIHSRLLDMR